MGKLHSVSGPPLDFTRVFQLSGNADAMVPDYGGMYMYTATHTQSSSGWLPVLCGPYGFFMPLTICISDQPYYVCGRYFAFPVVLLCGTVIKRMCVYINVCVCDSGFPLPPLSLHPTPHTLPLPAPGR